MSKDNCFPYLNNVLFCLKEGTPLLIKSYKTQNIKVLSDALIAGGHTNILFSNIEERNLLPHININNFYDINHKVQEYVYNGCEYKKDEDILPYLNEILNLWAELHEKTLKLLLRELKEHFEILRTLEGDDLFNYCFELIPYWNNYRKEFIDHFIQEVVYKHIKKI